MDEEESNQKLRETASAILKAHKPLSVLYFTLHKHKTLKTQNTQLKVL